MKPGPVSQLGTGTGPSWKKIGKGKIGCDPARPGYNPLNFFFYYNDIILILFKKKLTRATRALDWTRSKTMHQTHFYLLNPEYWKITKYMVVVKPVVGENLSVCFCVKTCFFFNIFRFNKIKLIHFQIFFIILMC